RRHGEAAHRLREVRRALRRRGAGRDRNRRRAPPRLVRARDRGRRGRPGRPGDRALTLCDLREAFPTPAVYLRAMTSVKLSLLALTSVTSLSLLSGCGFLKSLVGKNSVDLEGATVKSMAVDIRKGQKTICPRESVQMGVFAEVVLKGDSDAKKLETYTG